LTSTTSNYTLSLHDALPILPTCRRNIWSWPRKRREHPTSQKIFLRTVSYTPRNSCAWEPGSRLKDGAPWFNLDPGSHAQEFLGRSEEHTSELQSRGHLVCRL